MEVLADFSPRFFTFLDCSLGDYLLLYCAMSEIDCVMLE